MAYGDNNKHFEQLKLPMTWAVMGIVGVVCVGAALLFLGDRREEVEPGSFANRAGFDGVASLPDKALALPVHAVGDGTNWLDDYLFAVRENRVLKRKVAELSQYRDLYTEEKDINARYEKLLNLRTEPAVEAVTARSVAVSRGPFANNRLINAGSSKRITFGNPVITEHGLVGRVIGVSPDVSRVLMVTDVTSNVPVMILRSDARAMMRGDGGGYPRLEFVRGKDSVKVGDQILSSGDGGIYPRGLPVGEAVKGVVDGVWRVRLYANRSSIDFVKVLLFKDFSQLPNADTLLRTPAISDVLPPPALPPVQAGAPASGAPGTSASASGAVSSVSASVVATSASASAVQPPVVKPKPPTKPKPKPVTPPPTATSSSAPAVEPELRPFVPAAAPTGQN